MASNKITMWGTDTLTDFEQNSPILKLINQREDFISILTKLGKVFEYDYQSKEYPRDLVYRKFIQKFQEVSPKFIQGLKNFDSKSYSNENSNEGRDICFKFSKCIQEFCQWFKASYGKSGSDL